MQMQAAESSPLAETERMRDTRGRGTAPAKPCSSFLICMMFVCSAARLNNCTYRAFFALRCVCAVCSRRASSACVELLVR